MLNAVEKKKRNEPSLFSFAHFLSYLFFLKKISSHFHPGMPPVIDPSIDATVAAIGAGDIAKILILGNSGVGKSMLLNVLLESDEFESKFSSTAVTKVTELDVLHIDDTAYLLYNVPGLLDPDANVAMKNGAEIEKAIRDRSNTAAISLFVLTVEGGRLRAEDLEAWAAITKYAPAIKDLTAVTFVVNKICEDDFESQNDRDDYELAIHKQIRRFTNANYTIVLLPKLSKEDKASPKSPARLRMRARLITAIDKLEGVALRVAEGARIQLHSEVLKKEIDETRAAMVAMQAKFEAEAKQNAETHQMELAAMRVEAERDMREVEARHARDVEDLRAKIAANKADSDANLSQLQKSLEASEKLLAESREQSSRNQEAHSLAMQQMMQQMQMQMMQLSLQPMPMQMGGGGGFDYGVGMSHVGGGRRSYRRSHRSSHSSGHRSRHLHSAPSSHRNSAMNWNEFRTANGGKGWSREDFSRRYAAHKEKYN